MEFANHGLLIGAARQRLRGDRYRYAKSRRRRPHTRSLVMYPGAVIAPLGAPDNEQFR